MGSRVSNYYPSEFVSLLKHHGYHLKNGGKHIGIYKGEQKVYTIAGTPKQMHQACDNNIKHMIRLGLLPHGIKYRGRIYKRKI